MANNQTHRDRLALELLLRDSLERLEEFTLALAYQGAGFGHDGGYNKDSKIGPDLRDIQDAHSPISVTLKNTNNDVIDLENEKSRRQLKRSF